MLNNLHILFATSHSISLLLKPITPPPAKHLQQHPTIATQFGFLHRKNSLRRCYSSTTTKEELHRRVSSDDDGQTSNNNNNSSSNIPITPADEARRTTTKTKSKNYWLDIENQRRFFEEVAAELGIKQLDDWYRFKGRDIIRRRGATLMSHYGNSLVRALQAVYPDHPWNPAKFPHVPHGYWQDLGNQRRFLDAVAKELGITHMDEWYSVKVPQLKQHQQQQQQHSGSRSISRGIVALLKQYPGGGLPQALQAVYPEHNWDPARFSSRAAHGHWKDVSNHRRFLDQLAQELGIDQQSSPEGWYRVTVRDVRQRPGGASLLLHYGNSLLRMLQAVYPEHPWDGSRFGKVPQGYWEDVNNQRAVFDRIAKELAIEHPYGWYRVTNKQVHKLGGGSILFNYYGNSLLLALQAIYPDVQWQPWGFKGAHRYLRLDNMQPPPPPPAEPPLKDNNHNRNNNSSDDNMSLHSSSSSSNNSEIVVERYIHSLAEKLGIHNLDEWYRVSTSAIREYGGYAIIEHHGGLCNTLMKVYPRHNWDPQMFQMWRGKRASQRWLRVKLKEILPNNDDIFEDFVSKDLVYSGTNEGMRMDIYVPSLSLALEYHGKQHFSDVFFFGSQTRFQEQDHEKIEACKRANITLICVPYWWDHTAASLAATIYRERPDLTDLALFVSRTNPSAKPIPQSPPQLQPQPPSRSRSKQQEQEQEQQATPATNGS